MADPTAEVPLNIVAGEIVDVDTYPSADSTYTLFPVRGWLGRDTRGMIRQHQLARSSLLASPHHGVCRRA